MTRNRILLVLPLVLALAACDGGARGSGITTAEGNLESTQTALRGIHVGVEGSTVTDDTDDAGSFSLRGTFEGDVVIRFERQDGSFARMPVNAPAGGVLTLEDVHVDTTSGVATAATQSVVFDALVVGTDCGAPSLDLVSRHRKATDTDVYAVRLENSTIREGDGSPLSCPDLREGDAVDVRGTVNDDGTFGHAEIVRR
jgi:hypothetical protein